MLQAKTFQISSLQFGRQPFLNKPFSRNICTKSPSSYFGLIILFSYALNKTRMIYFLLYHVYWLLLQTVSIWKVLFHCTCVISQTACLYSFTYLQLLNTRFYSAVQSFNGGAFCVHKHWSRSCYRVSREKD